MEQPSGSFIVESRDPLAGVVKTFTLSFWASDGSSSLYDGQRKQFFLKRTTTPERLTLASFTIGAPVIVNGKPYKVVDFADELTRFRLTQTRGSMALVVKPDGYPFAGKIMTMLYEAGLAVGRVLMLKLSQDEALHLLSLGRGGGGRSDLAGGAGGRPEGAATRPLPEVASDAKHMASDVCLAIEVSGDNIMARLHELAGPADPGIARETCPYSIRAGFGMDRTRNAVYVSPTQEAGAAELAYLFDTPHAPTSVHTHCALVLVRPHAVAARVSGKVVDALLAAGLEVSAVRSMTLTRADAADYLEAYRGVVPEYDGWVAELASGPALAIEARGEDAVDRVRELAGPYDPAIARHLRPDTLRALYGVDALRNGVHVTDLPADGPLECKFMFKVL